MSKAETLNHHCICQTLDYDLLKKQLHDNNVFDGIFDEIVHQRPHLLSLTNVFINPGQLEQMRQAIEAIESVIANTGYQQLVLSRSPEIAHLPMGTQGVFMGYDFHFDESGPKIIEINTNAGGALINYELALAQKNCCPEVSACERDLAGLTKLESDLIEMFLNEWRIQKGQGRPALIAIVDDQPTEQFLYPEFKLFERLFSKYGIKSVIADPKDLLLIDGALTLHGEKIDMVYNRLTDFYLEQPDHYSIREAYLAKSIVLTPAPRHHALYANKLNLAVLTDQDLLKKWNIEASRGETIIRSIPKTVELTLLNQNELWDQRKHLFFKPMAGYGSKATYRGDKITHRVWEEIIHQKYIAQDIIPPSKRVIDLNGNELELKMDLRAYTYDGKIQLVAARLYSGQTTNFRTEGGGFAPVYVVHR